MCRICCAKVEKLLLDLGTSTWCGSLIIPMYGLCSYEIKILFEIPSHQNTKTAITDINDSARRELGRPRSHDITEKSTLTFRDQLDS